jgi:hypothetical protein
MAVSYSAKELNTPDTLILQTPQERLPYRGTLRSPISWLSKSAGNLACQTRNKENRPGPLLFFVFCSFRVPREMKLFSYFTGVFS